ncbi:unnamed protein product, partial [Polarella glacialis]
APKHLDVLQLLRAVTLGIGGKEPARRWQASSNLLQVVRTLVSGNPEALERARGNDGLQLVIKAWRQGGHIGDVAQECSTLTLQLAPKPVARAIAAAGGAECALSSWQRCGQENCRAALVQALAEVAVLCLPHLPDRPAVLPRLATDSLRALMGPGPASAVAGLLKALLSLAGDPKSAPELSALGVPELALRVIADERWGSEPGLRRLVAEVFVRLVALAVGSASCASFKSSASFQLSASPAWLQRLQCQLQPQSVVFGPPQPVTAWLSEMPQDLPPAALAAEAELATQVCPQPTQCPKACGVALRRRLESWRARAVATARGARAQESFDELGAEPVPELQLDANFESGSLGPVSRLGAHEYEVQLLGDSGPGGESYVQWFCFRVRQMRAGPAYTFHLSNLVKPGSLFDEGCKPVLFSTRRLQELGVAWSREGADVAYHPSGIAGFRRYHCVSFDIVFPFEDDEVFIAHA